MGIFSRNDLEERVRRLETAHKELALEWELAYEKLLKLMGRIAKRTAEQVPAEPDSDAEQTSVAPADGGPAFQRILTPRQHRIQSQIMRRRRLTEGTS